MRSPETPVKIPDDLARLLDLRPGTALDWQVSGPGSLLVQKHSPRGERADRLLGIERPFLQPGEDAVAELVQQ